MFFLKRLFKIHLKTNEIKFTIIEKPCNSFTTSGAWLNKLYRLYEYKTDCPFDDKIGIGSKKCIKCKFHVKIKREHEKKFYSTDQALLETLTSIVPKDGIKTTNNFVYCKKEKI